MNEYFCFGKQHIQIEIFNDQNKCSLFGRVKKPNAMDNTPDPADQNEGEKELKDSEEESCTVEFFTSAGGDHGADTRGEGDAVEDAAHECEGVIE